MKAKILLMVKRGVLKAVALGIALIVTNELAVAPWVKSQIPIDGLQWVGALFFPGVLFLVLYPLVRFMDTFDRVEVQQKRIRLGR